MIFMKKLIAIAVVFVLAVGVAFAVEVGVMVIGSITPIQGTSEDGSDVTVDGSFGKIRLSASAENEDGNFGGWFRYEAFTGIYPEIQNWSGKPWEDDPLNMIRAHGLVWWKPLDILKVQFGANPDGHWGMDGVTRWAFYQNANEVVAKESYSEMAFTGGFGRTGLFLELTPIEPLAINVAIPFIADMGERAVDVYKKLFGQVSYQIGDIGKVGVSYQGELHRFETSGADPAASKLYAYFGLTAIENLGIDLGVRYYLPIKSGVAYDANGDDYDIGWTVTRSKPVGLGLGVNFTTGQLGIKARVRGEFAGTTVNRNNDNATEKDDAVFVADLLPSFAINDKVSAYLDTGLMMTKREEFDAKVGWHIMPYVSVKAVGEFYAGLRFESEGKDIGNNTPDAVVQWSVPLGMIFSF
jgi:hypothetical protein